MRTEPVADDTDDRVAIETGRRVLRTEAAALELFAETLSAQFAEAVALILSIRGRVICSGMGKSGHVAHKIAATLASTGTPAFFVHPAEASHGDLGMITEHDVALVLSNSGETRELVVLGIGSWHFHGGDTCGPKSGAQITPVFRRFPRGCRW